MIMKLITLISAIFLCLLTTGCKTIQSTPTESSIISNNDASDVSDPATAQLAEAANSISQSLTDLKAISKASAPAINNKRLAYPTSTDMMELASVDWSGPIEPLLQRIASMCDYKLRVIGARPAIPVLVTVTAKNTPVSYILRDANFQAGTRASVLSYPGIRVIELRYGRA
jgi:defect-in-organelle-trafficking protein DotD